MKLQRKEAGLIYGNEYGMEKDNDNGRMKEGRKKRKMGYRNWKVLAQNRDNWRKIVEEAKVHNGL
jgi:hypothetical protein